MSVELSPTTLLELDAAVDRALRTADETHLEILGYGEISLVVAWPPERPVWACKRLPPFPNQTSVEAYRSNVEAYLARLAATGVAPLETAFQACPRDHGGFTGYCIQRVVAPEALVPTYLADCDETEALALWEQLLDRIAGCVSDRLGLDGQLSNWVLHEGRLGYLDVTTPMMRDEQGCDVLDADLFLAALPWILRAVVRRFLLGTILDKYYQLRGVVLDLLGNMIKEGLDAHLLAFLARANQRLTTQLAFDEVRRTYRADARMWALLFTLRRLDRSWQRRVRRRVYPFLLPREVERHV